MQLSLNTFTVCSSLEFSEFTSISYRHSLVLFTVTATVNKEMYIDILHHLRDAVKRKHLNECRTKSRFFVHDNAPGHWSILVKDFLAKHNVTILEHPPYCHNLTPAGYCLVPQLKSPLKGQCFCDATDIIENTMEELTRLSQNGFQECFQQLNSHWKTCIVTQADHFEG